MTRRGFALAAVLFALVVIGALVGGMFFASLEGIRASRGVAAGERALAAAERGADSVMSVWDRSRTARLAAGDVDSVTLRLDDGGATVWVTRLDDATFWIVSAGWSGGATAADAATRRINLLARLTTIDPRPPAALVTAFGATVEGTARVSGIDGAPDGWGARCGDTLTEPVGGIASPDPSAMVSAVIANPGALEGAPAVRAALAAADSGVSPAMGGAAWRALALDADTVPAAGAGVLLVDGDLDLVGPYRFDGLIVVRGTLRTVGNGVRVHGAVFAQRAVLGVGSSEAWGGAQIQYSRCALEQARNAMRPHREWRRGWVELGY